MQEAVSYKTWSPIIPQPKRANNKFNLNTSILSESTELQVLDEITTMVSENAAIVLGRPGCCMCHVIKHLLQSLGANPVVHEIKDDDWKYFDGKFETGKVTGGGQFPILFIGGKVYGGLEHVIASHISGDLVPELKQAGVLWL